MIQRAVTRVVPCKPVTLAVEERGQTTAYGVVANISERGACVLTDTDLNVGSQLLFALSFPSERQFLEMPGRVVWVRVQPGRLVRYGLSFEPLSVPESQQLATLVRRVAGH